MVGSTEQLCPDTAAPVLTQDRAVSHWHTSTAHATGSPQRECCTDGRRFRSPGLGHSSAGNQQLAVGTAAYLDDGLCTRRIAQANAW
jgi:hypothetical protein